jgi:Fe-S cluster assembly protein SufD
LPAQRHGRAAARALSYFKKKKVSLRHKIMDKNLRYTPEATGDFHCHVPLPIGQQLLLVNGICKSKTIPAQDNIAITPASKGNGLQITVSASKTPAQPIQIINTRNAENTAPLTCANTLTVEQGAQAKLIICDHTLSPTAFVTETTTDIILHPAASLEIIWMQSEHNHAQHRSVVRVQQAAGSLFSCNFITLHGACTENVVDIKLQGEHAHCQANGLFLIDGQQTCLTDITITHEVGYCHSHQIFKGIADNEAIGRFYGKVLVAKGAQKTEAYQTNNNLLLNGQAKIYTRPQLEIYADDVKCSHGATIGQLNEQALFYLRSRGISLKEARLLQQIGFVQDVLDKISITPLRERIAELVVKRLQGEFSRCSDCDLHCC